MSGYIKKNKYLYRAHISEGQCRALLQEFSRDSTAVETAQRTGLNRNTINRVFSLLRRRIAQTSEQEESFSGEVEVDESYFGARRVRGKRGRSGGKIPVVGLLKRGGRVFTHIVKNCTRAQIMPIIHGQGTNRKHDSYRWVDELRWTHCQRVSALSCVSLE